MVLSRYANWGEVKGIRRLETQEQMSDEYRDTVMKIIYALASPEFASVEQHQAWINKGPTPEDRFAQAQIAADEAHQGMEDCRLLASFGPDGEKMVEDLLRRKMGEHLLEAFNIPFESWADLTVFCCTMDLVAWYHLKAMAESSFAPLARSITSMLHEERFHASFGANRVKSIVSDPSYCGATKADVQVSLLKWYPRALDTFGRKESRFSDLAVKYGVRRWGNEDLRQLYMKEINPFLSKLDLEVPDENFDRHVI